MRVSTQGYGSRFGLIRTRILKMSDLTPDLEKGRIRIQSKHQYLDLQPVPQHWFIRNLFIVFFLLFEWNIVLMVTQNTLCRK